MQLYDQIVDAQLLVRRINISTNHVVSEEQAHRQTAVPVQLDMFTDYEALADKREKEEKALAKERRIQETTISIKQKFGRNSLLRGLNFEEGATARERNQQIGGHKA